MPKYRVRLESQEDEQTRDITLSRGTEDEARNDVQITELEYAKFKIPEDELKTMLETHSYDRKTGKVTGPDARTRGRIAAHYQKKPYTILSVEKVGR